jgi:acetylornithine deacetylase
MSRTLDHLERLVGFATLPGMPNGEIVSYVQAALQAAGARVFRIDDPDGDTSGLFASIGPPGPGGVMLSGHLDVVTVAGQTWSSDPFTLRRAGGRVFGRGTADMKGFLAAMLSLAETARGKTLAEPLKFAFSWDEEIGCRGIPVMLEHLDATVGLPEVCIVGEPTEMQIACGHKGKTALRAICTGQAGHSADAPQYENALHKAAEFIGALRQQQERLMNTGAGDASYGTPHSTVHAGVMRGGTALNLVPERAEILFEIRNLAEDSPEEIVARLQDAAARIGNVEIEITGGYPGLAADSASRAVALAQALLPEAALTKVSYGTEAGHFAAHGVATVVCGPGSMAQGHKADEFIAVAQLDACDVMLARLLERPEHFRTNQS